MKTYIINSLVTVLYLLFLTLDLKAQDVHFSQMEYSPLTLNPALTGANSTVQALVNYRNQWSSVASPYQTIAASIEGRFNENKRQKKGIIAGGLNFFNDQSGDLKVTTNNVNINLAYHLILDRTSTLGLGIYTGLGQRSINSSNARWGNQYDGISYNSSMESYEAINSAAFSYMDAGAGIVYTYKKNTGYAAQNDQRAFNLGFAAYHLNKPGFSYLNQNSEKLPIRWSGFANATISIGNTNGAILPGIYIQSQRSSMELLYGFYYKYLISGGSKATGFNKPMSIYFGIFNRFKDAVVGKLMFEWDLYSIGFGYDMNISTLTEVSRAKGGFELFLRFNINEGEGLRTRL